MKFRLAVAFISSTMLANHSAYADTFTAKAPITEVTVYKNGGALVTRRGSVHLPTGQHTILLQNLHEDLLQSHIQPYAIITSPGTSLTGMKLAAQPESNTASERQQALQQQIDRLENQIQTVQNEITASEIQLSLLKSLGTKQVGDTAPTNLDTFKSVLEFVGDNAGELLTGIHLNRQKVLSLKKDKKAVERELARTGTLREDYQQAGLHIQNTNEGSIEFSFNYFVNDASWDLDLQAALSSDTNKIAFTLAASISQQTGENWQDVKLSLSNSSPEGYVGDADVRPQFVSFTNHDSAKYRPLAIEKTSAPRQAMQEDIMITGNQTRVANSRFDRQYQLSDVNTIVSSGEAQKVEVISHTTDATLVTRATPYRSNSAYLFADTSLGDFISLRDIDVTLSRDGHYAGAGRWPNLELNQPLQLPFGPDSNISVTYQEQPPQDGDKGFINKKHVETKRYLVSVTNNNSVDTPVEILDRYPVSTHEDIKITPLKTATSPNESDLHNRPGVIKWSKLLKPGEVWHIRHEYSITYPADKHISKSDR